MFRRMFWFLTGATTGVWATVKVERAVRRLSPDSLAATAARRAVRTGSQLRLFARDVRAGMAQRELELQDALGLPQGEDAEGEKPLGLPARDSDHPAARRGITYTAYDRKDEH
jgi:hypothetical protein